MGLLNDTKSRRKMSAFIIQHSNKLMILSFIVGIIWFCLLASDAFNNKTYFSENALLPGLVDRKFNPGSNMKRLLDSLKDEVASHPSSLPSAWIQGHFRQIGLDVYENNFTIQYPLGPKPTFTGKNLYSILRAPKVASTEALVISTPYRDFESIHDNTLPSIVLMIELAHLFRHSTYWSKDIIFLITEHENIGFQAWLDAYHGVSTSDYIISEKLKSSSGLIQGVINLEISHERFSHIDVKIEGLHGQLPNLDLFNLAIELSNREQVPTSFHSRFDFYPSKTLTWESWLSNFITMSNMILIQATGLPNGGHGLFHRFAIQAVTLKSDVRKAEYSSVTLSHMGRVLEGMTRSLNNLLEKFHQSFFFYLLPSTRSYVSIGLYMPPFALIGLPILIKALYLYISLQNTDSKQLVSPQENNINYWKAWDIILLHVFLGVSVYFSPVYFDYLKGYFEYSTEDILYVMHLALLLSWILFVSCFNLNYKAKQSEYVFKTCIALLLLGASLYTLALVNISFAVILTVLFAPLSIIIHSRRLIFFQYFYLILINPFVFTYLIVVVQSYLMDNNIEWWTHFHRAINGHKKIILFAIEDLYFFNNWNYKIVTVVILPLWFNLWSLKMMKVKD